MYPADILSYTFTFIFPVLTLVSSLSRITAMTVQMRMYITVGIHDDENIGCRTLFNNALYFAFPEVQIKIKLHQIN